MAPKQNASSRNEQSTPATVERGLRLLLEMAMKNSLEKLSAMLKASLTLEEICVTPGGSLREALSNGSGAYCAVLLGVRGDGSGQLVVQTGQADAERVCEMAPEELRQYLPGDADHTRLLFEELGNLLASTYLDVFSDVSGLRLLPTAPFFVETPDARLSERLDAPVGSSASHLLTSRVRFGDSTVCLTVAALLPDCLVTKMLAGARRHLPELF